jgi:hypothetical protein
MPAKDSESEICTFLVSIERAQNSQVKDSTGQAGDVSQWQSAG